jgi:hypothetical protein
MLLITPLVFRNFSRYKCIALWRDESYFVKINNSNSTKTFSENNIIQMFEFLIDNLFEMFYARVLQRVVFNLYYNSKNLLEYI